MQPDLSFVFQRFYISALLCFAAGSALALSMAPANAWFILFLSFPVLYMALHYSPNRKQAFALGWLFGFGYFVFGLSWIGNALLVEGNPYQWAWPLAVSGLPALLAFFPALAALLSQYFKLNRLSGFPACVVLFAGAEWLRGHVFTGFPWNLYGYAWVDILEIVQIVSVGSIYLLTSLSIFWAMSIGFLLVSANRAPRILIGLMTLLSFGACFVYGCWRLETIVIEDHEHVQARLVQPNIAQADKWDREKMQGHFETLLNLSRDPLSSNKTTYIIWPETATTGGFISNPNSLGAILSMLDTHPAESVLLTGALLQQFDGGYTNSLVLIEGDGAISNIYDKQHLVPFGEYIPFQKWIPLKPIVQFTGFKAGEGLGVYDIKGGLRYRPLICYEIIFPRSDLASGSSPDFIINVTNDAWYGDSAAPHQHFTQALFRAVETGVPVLRVANTGFTGLIDPLGQVRSKSLLFKNWAQNITIPKKL